MSIPYPQLPDAKSDDRESQKQREYERELQKQKYFCGVIRANGTICDKPRVAGTNACSLAPHINHRAHAVDTKMNDETVAERLLSAEEKCVANKADGDRCGAAAQTGWMTCHRETHRVQAPRRRSYFELSTKSRPSQSQEPSNTCAAGPVSSKSTTGSVSEEVEDQVDQQTNKPTKDPGEKQAEGLLGRQQHLSPLGDQKVGLLGRASPQPDINTLMKTEFQTIQSQLDVFLQAAASKIDGFGRHHQPQRSSSENITLLEALSNLNVSIAKTATDHEAKSDQIAKDSKVETEEIQRSIGKLASTHQASRKRADEDYEELARGLNNLLADHQNIGKLVENCSKNQADSLNDLAHDQAQHEERHNEAYTAVRSDLSAIKSAIKDLHDQTHTESRLNQDMKELRLRQIQQYDRVAKLKDDLVAKYKLGGG